jgi:asparagine synthase (glutamine-hydrolysing)
MRTNGHAFREGDASFLVHLYEETGIELIAKLNGAFSGLLVDLRKRRIVLFNDRYGLQRIYYHEHATGFYFSSEAKSLLRALPELRDLDLTSLAQVFSFGCVLGNKTLFRHIALLPGASRWTFTEDRTVARDTYFSPEQWETQEPLGDAEYYETLKATFCRILPRYLRDRDRMAMSLTGGMDGRLIMAWASCPPGSLPCYTFGGSFRDCADVTIARRVANLCDQPHQVIPVGKEFIEQFPRLVEAAVYVSDGTMDVTGSVELYVNRQARAIAPIRLTGNYGSEIVRGNVAFRPVPPQPQLVHPQFLGLIRDAESVYVQQRQCRDLTFLAFKQVPWHHYSRLSIEQSQLTPRSPYLDNELVSLMYRAPAHLVRSSEPSLRLIAEGNPRLARLPTDRGLAYRGTSLAARCRAHYQTFTTKAEYAYDYGMPQWLSAIDHAFAGLHLERIFLGRHKFYHFRVWYRDKLAEYLKDTLLDARSRSRPYIHGPYLETMIREHTSGRRNHTSDIHLVLGAELLQRSLIEQD